VVAPSNSAEILRNFWRSSCSVVICKVRMTDYSEPGHR
jgi:hypothetical protein